MIVGWLRVAAPVALLVFGSPLAAQAHAGTEDSTQRDLRCATWAAYMAGAAEDQEAAQGLAVALAWFIGRYEGATNRKIEQAMTPDFIRSLETEMDAVHAECLPRMQQMGDRLTKLGAELQAAGV